MWQELKVPGPLRSLLAFTVGVLVPVAGHLFSQTMRAGRSIMDNGELPSPGPWPIQLLFRISNLFVKINSWPWILLVFLLFVSFAIVRRRNEKGWTFAFVAGVAFLEVLRQVVFRM